MKLNEIFDKTVRSNNVKRVEQKIREFEKWLAFQQHNLTKSKQLPYIMNHLRSVVDDIEKLGGTDDQIHKIKQIADTFIEKNGLGGQY